jgi:hypothetical protein
MEPEHQEWDLRDDQANKAAFPKFYKRHRREYGSLFTNLDKILKLLNAGNKIGGFQVGFFRSEGAGVYRIGQTGVPGAKESRLYVFPDQETKTMHILEIGTKDTQTADINEAKNTVKRIRQESPPA